MNLKIQPESDAYLDYSVAMGMTNSGVLVSTKNCEILTLDNTIFNKKKSSVKEITIIFLLKLILYEFALFSLHLRLSPKVNMFLTQTATVLISHFPYIGWAFISPTTLKNN